MKRALLVSLLALATAAPSALAHAPQTAIVSAPVVFDGRVLVRLAPGEASSLRAESSRGLARMRAGSSVLRGLAATHAVRSVAPVVSAEQLFPEALDVGLDRWFVIEVDAAPGYAAVAAELSSLPGVELVEPDLVEGAFHAAPNDSLYPKNWGHNNTATFPAYSAGSHSGANVGTVSFDTNVLGGWLAPSAYGHPSVVIGILDTGVDPTHPDILQVQGTDTFSADSIAEDTHGHGTACAGVAAGIANNTRGVAGTAGGCSIMPLRFSEGATFSSFRVVNAITFAVANGADVISMSFGMTRTQAMANAMTAAEAAGVVLLASSGNSNTSAMGFPANHPKVIAIGAASPCAGRKRSSSNAGQVNPGVGTDSLGVSCDNETWWGSTWGTAVANDSAAVDLIAPTMVPATDIQGAAGFSANGYSDYFNGTSCSSPYAAGVAALIRSQHPTWTAAQVRARLIETAFDVSDVQTPVGWDKYTGYGMVNAGLPDVVPFAFGGWSSPVVPRPAADASFGSVPAPSTLNGDGISYINVGLANLGEARTGLDAAGILIDGGEIGGVGYDLFPGAGGFLLNIPWQIAGGRHVVGLVTDTNNDLDEMNELNNRNAHQWSLVPTSMPTSASAVVSRNPPPLRTGGRADVPVSETTYDNVDAVRMIGPEFGSSIEFWLMGLHPADDATDLDLSLHLPTSSATTNFTPGNHLISSTFGTGLTDWAIVNLGLDMMDVLDASSLKFGGTGGSRFESRLSGDLASVFSGSTITINGVAFGNDQMLAVHDLNVIAGGEGSVSLELNSSAPLHMALYDAPMTFANRSMAVQLSTQIGLVQGLTRTLPQGRHGLVVYRDRNEGTAPLTYTITIRRPTAELTASTAGIQFAPSGVFKSGVGNLGSAPTVLDGNVNNTHFYYGYTNNGPATASGFTARELLDGGEILTWVPGPLNAGGSASWTSGLRQIRGGRHTMGFRNDFSNVIDEFNEIDNDHASQWVWSPLALTMEVPVSRTAPPDRTGGWAQVPVSTTTYDNVDGLRTPVLQNTGNDGYWNFFALAPRTVGDDVDLAAYFPLSTGPGNGFTTPLGSSALPAGRTDYVGIDVEGFFHAVDFGIVKAGAATGNVVTHGTRSIFLPTDLGTYGPYALNADRLVAAFEFASSLQQRTVRLINHSGSANLDLHVYERFFGDPITPHLPADALTADVNGDGMNEELEVTPTSGFPVIVVTKRGTSDIGKSASFSIELGNQTTDVDTDHLPTVVRLSPVRPNPVQAMASIVFDLPREGAVELSAFDVTGRRVATLASGTMPAGRHAMSWDARGASGARLASGVYLLRLSADGVESVRRMVVTN